MNDGVKIQNCTLEGDCPKVWSALKRTGNNLIRHCDVCQKEVHYCGTLKTATEKTQQGLCIVVSKHAETGLHLPKKRIRHLRIGEVKAAKVVRVTKAEPPKKDDRHRRRGTDKKHQ